MVDWGGKVIPPLVGVAGVSAALAVGLLTRSTAPLRGAAHTWFVVLLIIAFASLAALLLIALRAVLAPWRDRRKRRSQRHTLRQDDSLLAGQSLYSPDGLTRFTLNPDGNMVVYVEGRKDICNTGTGNMGQPRRLTLDRDGWLILSDVNNQELWKRGPGGVRLEVQDDAHVVLYPPTGTPGAIWCTDRYVTAGLLALDISPGSDWRWRSGEHGGLHVQPGADPVRPGQFDAAGSQ
jgi:hypothetical protein